MSKKSKLKNTVILHNGYAEIIAESANYKHSVLIDIEDIQKVGKVRVTNKLYAYQCKQNAKPVSCVVMNFDSNRKKVVDHINGNRLDNRKSNLRIVSQRQNVTNKRTYVRNNTGVVGISYRENGKYKYYRVSLTIPNTKSRNNRQGKKYTKQFNISRLGKEKAFLLAQEHLLEKKKEFGYLI